MYGIFYKLYLQFNTYSRVDWVFYKKTANCVQYAGEMSLDI